MLQLKTPHLRWGVWVGWWVFSWWSRSREYIDNQPEGFRPELLNTIVEKYADVQAYVDELFANTMFVSEENVNKFLDEFKASKAKKLAKDPALMAYNNVMDFYLNNVKPKSVELNDQISDLQRVFMRGQMEYHADQNPDKKIYPDANFTLRVTYGKIGGFSPKDAVRYKHFTTLDGIMQKENPAIYDYVVTDRLRELYEEKDYGRYADKDGSMHVAFIAGNHTTGGNSGSPILNADGHLLALRLCAQQWHLWVAMIPIPMVQVKSQYHPSPPAILN